MRRALLALVLAGGCTTPRYQPGHLACASGTPACPDNFYCAPDHRCWPNGGGPDFAGGLADLGPTHCATALLCESFDAPLGARWMANVSNSGTVAIDGVHAFRGGAALHAHHDAVNTGPIDVAATVGAGFAPAASGTLYARLWVYLTSPRPPAAGATAQLLNFQDMTGTGLAGLVDNFDRPGNNSYTAPKLYKTSPDQTWPLDRWTCLRMQITQTGATGDVHLFMGADEVHAALTGVGTPRISFAIVGLFYYQTPSVPVEDAWFDELLVDDKPIGCDDI